MASKFKVIIAGASGATGKLVLNRLLNTDDVEKITAIGRRKLEIDNPKLEQRIVNFDELPDDLCAEHDVAICTLGAPRTKYGKEMFIKVEQTYVLAFAERCKKSGVKQFHMLSGHGADATSRFLYYQIKGEVDTKIADMGFERAIIYRPAVLLVERSDSRFYESVVRSMFSAFDFRRSMSIKSDDIAKVIVYNMSTAPTKNILTNTEIHALAKTLVE